MTEREKMLAGRLYEPLDPELVTGRARARDLCHRLNATPMTKEAERAAILKELVPNAGENFYVENDFRCDYGSYIYTGKNFFANFGCVMLDVAPIRLGDNVFLATNVQLLTATHPLIASERSSGVEYAKPITIGNDVWLGGGVIVNPGVTIGDQVVIGSGSVVTRDIPSGVVAVGNPCRVLRKITEADRMIE